MQVAIDGPASAGKSTVAKILAKKLDLIYLDTGAMYRTITYLGLKNNADLTNGKELLNLLEKAPIRFETAPNGQKVFAGNEEVTEQIRTDEVNANVSIPSAVKEVREEMVRLQQKIANSQGIVMDGRDIGTAVLPNADTKIFLIASVEERAKRRYEENLSKGLVADFEEIKKSIENRDYLDTHREVSPLTKATDAFEVDTTGLSIEEVVEKIEKIINNK